MLGIDDFLRTDIVSRTPADVIAANPGMFTGSPQASYVPQFLYRCLLDLLTGKDATHGGDVNYLNNHVVGNYGQGDTFSDAGIELSSSEGDSALVNEGLKSDVVGARTAYMKILCRVANVPGDPDTLENLVDNLSLRIQYILDGPTRGLFKGGGTVIGQNIYPELADNTIFGLTIVNPNGRPAVMVGVRALWLRDLKDPSALERLTLWRIEYSRLFAK